MEISWAIKETVRTLAGIKTAAMSLSRRLISAYLCWCLRRWTRQRYLARKTQIAADTASQRSGISQLSSRRRENSGLERNNVLTALGQTWASRRHTTFVERERRSAGAVGNGQQRSARTAIVTSRARNVAHLVQDRIDDSVSTSSNLSRRLIDNSNRVGDNVVRIEKAVAVGVASQINMLGDL